MPIQPKLFFVFSKRKKSIFWKILASKLEECEHMIIAIQMNRSRKVPFSNVYVWFLQLIYSLDSAFAALFVDINHLILFLNQVQLKSLLLLGNCFHIQPRDYTDQ